MVTALSSITHMQKYFIFCVTGRVCNNKNKLVVQFSAGQASGRYLLSNSLHRKLWCVRLCCMSYEELWTWTFFSLRMFAWRYICNFPFPCSMRVLIHLFAAMKERFLIAMSSLRAILTTYNHSKIRNCNALRALTIDLVEVLVFLLLFFSLRNKYKIEMF